MGVYVRKVRIPDIKTWALHVQFLNARPGLARARDPEVMAPGTGSGIVSGAGRGDPTGAPVHPQGRLTRK